MGIQSTRYVTRRQAEEIFVQQYFAKNLELIQKEANLLSNSELEDEIELTYDNYTIKEQE